MLNIQNKLMEEVSRSNRAVDKNLIELKGILDQKMSVSLRYSGIKNTINNAATYHYLMIPIVGSTEATGDNDYIAPTVKGAVDYVSAAVTKGLSPNGGIKFEYVSMDETDEAASRQATNMVSYILNSQLNFHTTISDWVMDGCLNKNGMMLVRPIRELSTSYRTIRGNLEQIKAFEMQVADSGATSMIKSKRKVDVDLVQVKNEMASLNQESTNQLNDDMLNNHMNNIVNGDLSPEEIDEEHRSEDGIIAQNTTDQEDALEESLERNTIYEVEFKISGYNFYVKLQPIKQHFWTCDPTVNNVQDQPYCGFYEQMTIQEATERYPNLRLDDFTTHAKMTSGGLDVAGGTIYSIAIHARDSIVTPGLTPSLGSSVDEHNRRVGVSTMWYRYDIDNDGEMELVELIFSGDYIISAKEVEFIPVANLCPRRLPNNFYGMSIAESVVSQQEYTTGASRAEIQLGLQMATPRLAVNANKIDFGMLQSGSSSLLQIEDDFDPSRHIYPIPGPNGNLTYLAESKNSIKQDTMTITGMVTPNDTFNPEVMADGNSGIKLQLALTPNQIILDNCVKNCAEGIKEAIWIIWRTLIQYSDDFGVKKLARKFHPDKQPIFIDAQNWDDMNFYERKDIQLELALGLLSAENSMSRLEIIKATQKQFWDGLNQITQSGHMTESIFTKLRKPHERVLYELSIKDVNEYLPTWDDAQVLQQQYQQAAQSSGQDPDSLVKQSTADLNKAKAYKLQEDAQNEGDKLALEAIALSSGKATNY